MATRRVVTALPLAAAVTVAIAGCGGGTAARSPQLSSLPLATGVRVMTNVRQCADLTWEQAIAMEEFAEPMCFTTEAHQRAVQELLAGQEEASSAPRSS